MSTRTRDARLATKYRHYQYVYAYMQPCPEQAVLLIHTHTPIFLATAPAPNISGRPGRHNAPPINPLCPPKQPRHGLLVLEPDPLLVPAPAAHAETDPSEGNGTGATPSRRPRFRSVGSPPTASFRQRPFPNKVRVLASSLLLSGGFSACPHEPSLPAACTLRRRRWPCLEGNFYHRTDFLKRRPGWGLSMGALTPVVACLENPVPPAG